MNGPRRWIDHVTDRFHAQLGRDSDTCRDLFHALNALFPFVGMSWAGKALPPIRAIQTGPPPVRVGFFPQHPFFAGFVGKKIFALKSFSHREPLSAFSNQHDMSGMTPHSV